ncbi:MAG: hypothetical protein LBH07_04040 [Treponema sp.]|nr:hypothetical protein [Treponema sp.]
MKRTKPHIARYPLEQFLGREGKSLDKNEVLAVVKDTGVLEPVEVELIEEEEGLILCVTVEEKWAIFPIPLVIGGSGGTNFGIFFADTNAFGLRDQAALGGMYGSSGIFAMAVYRHTPARRRLPGWNSFFMYGRREQEDLDRDERIHRLYTIDQLRLSLGLFYPFSGHITGSAAFSFTDISPKENPKKNIDAINTPENGVRILGFTPGLSLRYSSWDGFLLSQKSLSLDYSYNAALVEFAPSFHQVDFRGIYEQSLVPGLRFILRSGAVVKSGFSGGPMDSFFEEGPQKAQVDILPRKFSALHYAGFSTGFEKSLFNVKWGTFSVLGSWQCVFSRGPISGDEFDQGPSGGFRFYLRRLALPALGANLAYNMYSGLYQFVFSLGMEF